MHSHFVDPNNQDEMLAAAAGAYVAVFRQGCMALPASCSVTCILCMGVQVHLTYWSSKSVLVSWASCDAQLKQTQSVAADRIRSVVHYGTSKDGLHHTAEGVATSYVNEYAAAGTSYASPLLHHVLLKGGLVGWCAGASTQYSMATASAVAPSTAAAAAAVRAIAAGCSAP